MFFVYALIALFLLNHWWFKDKVKLYEAFKTDVRAWPIVGHGLWFMGTNEDRMYAFKMCGEVALKNGGIASFWLAQNLYLVIADPAIAELILKTTAEKNDIVRFTRILIGNGIIFAPAAIWRSRRKNMAPTFSQRNLNVFVDIFSKQSRILADRLKEVAGKGDFPIWRYITCYTMDSVCESALGFQMKSQSNPDQPFFHAFEKCCQLVVDRMVQPWLYSPLIYKLTPYHSEFMKNVNYVQTFVKKMIAAKREELARKIDKVDTNNNEGPTNDLKPFLELLIESSGKEKGYTDIELLEETLVLVLGGTDTSAVSICYTTLMLAKHPDVQEKVYQEIFEVFGDSDRPMTHEDIPRLKYLAAVIRETLRLYPPVPILIPGLDRNITLPSGITVPSDTGIVINILAMHHDPKHWGEDVEEFKPERFIDAKPNPAFMAFSAGLRSCIGYRYSMMSITTVISTLIRRYRILPATCTRNGIPLRLKYEVMMKDADNFQIQLEPRKELHPIVSQ
ncbi:hypothetical protein K1T71_006929 [Dendrolimus kikuchii]|uniref:Uncharacterized protein n=1 Tax=Dendrolimus kikuchii TaxID=765133 RepID=A0ACC1CZC9_9NEOP|nr:hypothetical protein K1T71_006929 [Dendrolimus kikuchii]